MCFVRTASAKVNAFSSASDDKIACVESILDFEVSKDPLKKTQYALVDFLVSIHPP